MIIKLSIDTTVKPEFPHLRGLLVHLLDRVYHNVIPVMYESFNSHMNMDYVSLCIFGIYSIEIHYNAL